MRWKGLEMDWGDNKFNATVSQTLNPTNIKDMVQEARKIIGVNEMPLIFCNPANYEFVKQSLEKNFGTYNLVKTLYVEDVITVVTDENTKMDILEFLHLQKLV